VLDQELAGFEGREERAEIESGVEHAEPGQSNECLGGKQGTRTRLLEAALMRVGGDDEEALS
jgi:hypothetical protein